MPASVVSFHTSLIKLKKDLKSNPIFNMYLIWSLKLLRLQHVNQVHMYSLPKQRYIQQDKIKGEQKWDEIMGLYVLQATAQKIILFNWQQSSWG